MRFSLSSGTPVDKLLSFSFFLSDGIVIQIKDKIFYEEERAEI
jgi:hypothetical protein